MRWGKKRKGKVAPAGLEPTWYQALAEAFSPTIGYKKRIGGLVPVWPHGSVVRVVKAWVRVLRVPLSLNFFPPHYLENFNFMRENLFKVHVYNSC